MKNLFKIVFVYLCLISTASVVFAQQQDDQQQTQKSKTEVMTPELAQPSPSQPQSETENQIAPSQSAVQPTAGPTVQLSLAPVQTPITQPTPSVPVPPQAPVPVPTPASVSQPASPAQSQAKATQPDQSPASHTPSIQKRDKRSLTVMTSDTPSVKIEKKDLLTQMFTPAGDALYGFIKTSSDAVGGICQGCVNAFDGTMKFLLTPFGFKPQHGEKRVFFS